MIYIGERYRLRVHDDLNIVLEYKTKARILDKDASKEQRTRVYTGETKVKWDILGYYASPHSALKEMVNHTVRKTDLKDTETVCKKMDTVYNLINRIPKKSWKMFDNVG